jgi:hypothetical protein
VFVSRFALYRTLFDWLLELMNDVVDHAGENFMNPANLGIVMGPNLLPNVDAANPMQALMLNKVCVSVRACVCVSVCAWPPRHYDGLAEWGTIHGWVVWVACACGRLASCCLCVPRGTPLTVALSCDVCAHATPFGAGVYHFLNDADQGPQIRRVARLAYLRATGCLAFWAPPTLPTLWFVFVCSCVCVLASRRERLSFSISCTSTQSPGPARGVELSCCIFFALVALSVAGYPLDREFQSRLPLPLRVSGARCRYSPCGNDARFMIVGDWG